MADIRFRNTAHRDFFLENMMKCRVNDCYHRAFFYVMGIAEETRNNINTMFDFKTDCIVPEGMHSGWQTSGTVKVCHLAFMMGEVSRILQGITHPQTAAHRPRKVNQTK